MAPPNEQIKLILILISIMFLFSWGVLFLFMRFNLKKRQLIQEKTDLQTAFQRELLKTQLETQEEAFHQIGQELHDNVAQLLGSARLLLGIAQRKMVDAPDVLATADQTLDKAILELRSLSKSLNPDWLSQFDLLRNVQAEVDRINYADGIQVRFTTSTASLPLGVEAQLMLFRIVQEALQNSLKHSGASMIEIKLEQTPGVLTVLVADDGIGVEASGGPHAGMGMMHMKHRAKLLGGTIAWQKQEPNGTEVCIKLPTQNNAL